MDDDGIDIDKSILKAILKGLKALFKQLFTMYNSLRQAISFSLKDAVLTMALVAIMLCILGLQPRDKSAMLGVKTKEYFLEEFT